MKDYNRMLEVMTMNLNSILIFQQRNSLEEEIHSMLKLILSIEERPKKMVSPMCLNLRNSLSRFKMTIPKIRSSP
jgi:hypothetical protein